ncbi:MAG: hypothetical protein WBA97_37465 [Actinophytocola sp.]|uniref:hypothetical protein n=1 Tax=Actinophytocola sp. TaxID=1872138 RepID=UPI003C73A932
MSEGRFGGELEPYTAAAIRAVANPDNWRGLNEKGKADLQAEIDKNLTKEQKRTVNALIKKGHK